MTSPHFFFMGALFGFLVEPPVPFGLAFGVALEVGSVFGDWFGVTF
jgi:hypothetical protein